MADTVILTMSEFGRAVAENGNRGTDHGHGNAMMLIGGAGQGRQGLRPVARPGARSQRYEGRDLAVTTDFRDVFGEVVVSHLGASVASAGRGLPRLRAEVIRVPGSHPLVTGVTAERARRRQAFQLDRARA